MKCDPNISFSPELDQDNLPDEESSTYETVFPPKRNSYVQDNQSSTSESGFPRPRLLCLLPPPPNLDKSAYDVHSDPIIDFIDLTKFDFNQIRHELSSKPYIRFIICIDCGTLFDRNLAHSLLYQHFQAEPFHSAIDIEHCQVIFMKTMKPLKNQPFLDSFYLSIYPNLLSTWISNCFFKPFFVMSETLTVVRRDIWEEININPMRAIDQNYNLPGVPKWDLYHLLPFLLLLPKDTFFGRSIREHNNCFNFTVS
jgi:hypothetical protein